MSILCCCAKLSRPVSPEANIRPLPTPPPPVTLPDLLPASTPVGGGSAPRAQTDHNASFFIRDYPLHGALAEPAELSELLVDESDNENDSAQGTRVRSIGSALDLVKSRIRGRISSGSIRRRSQPTTGDSEEAAARRAELRRLRHKRIQQELQCEESSVTLSGQLSSARGSNIYRDELPGGGPRDHVEFAVRDRAESERLAGSRTSSTGGNANLAQSSEPGEKSQPANLVPGIPGHDVPRQQRQSHAPPARGAAMRHSSPLPHIALFPVLAPMSVSPEPAIPSQNHQLPSAVRPPVSRAGPSTSGVGKRPAAERDENCRTPRAEPHSTGRNGDQESPSEQDFLSIVDMEPQDQSPLNTWLRSQGLCPRSHSAAASTAESQDEDDVIHEAQMVKLARPPSAVHGFDGSHSRDVTLSRTVHLYDMDIHQQLRPGGPSTPTASPSRSPVRVVHTRGPSMITQASRISSLSLPPAGSASSEPHTEKGAPDKPSHVGLDTRASSVYPSSSVDGERPSPAYSVFSVPKAVISRKGARRFQLPSFRRK